MNLKERGFTVGDLFILIFIISTILFVKNINKEKKTNSFLFMTENILQKNMVIS